MTEAINYKSLTIDSIESSPEINDWLSQFPEDKRITAKTLLFHLTFVSRDTYSDWLRIEISKLTRDQKYALYAVRKLDRKSNSFWGSDGRAVTRPGHSQGSEDLVYSLIANMSRASRDSLLDHPSIETLRDKKINNYILIDDSIGSGDRVSKFINAMLSHPTLLSWWSFGYIKIHVISFARPKESESKILFNVLGSNHGRRKNPKASKIKFTSKFVYSTQWIESRWGGSHEKILDLCDSTTKIDKDSRRGYGKVMANIVFYHSVPNNLPGMIWCQNKRWNGLFPGRALPDWLPPLLERKPSSSTSSAQHIPTDVIKLLILLKRGVRSIKTISERLNCDSQFSIALISKAQELRLVTDQNRLTALGFNTLKSLNDSNPLPTWDTSLYIPESWCAG